MKFTLSWLKEHLDTTASVDEIAETLTDLGLEVEGVENPAASTPIMALTEWPTNTTSSRSSASRMSSRSSA